MHVALVGGHAVQDAGPDRGVPRLLENRRPVLNIDALSAEPSGSVRREDAERLGFLLQLEPQVLVETVARPGLVSDEFAPDEFTGLDAEVLHVGWQRGHHVVLSVPSIRKMQSLYSSATRRGGILPVGSYQLLT